MAQHLEIASSLTPVVDGIWHWHVATSGAGSRVASSHAFRIELDDGRVGCVLVDPVRLDGHAMQQLPHVLSAIVLTSATPQRAAWRLRELHGAPVWAPVDVDGLDEEPDERYAAGDELPGGLVAIHTPGAGRAAYSLHLPSRDAVFISDLLEGGDGGAVSITRAGGDRDAALESVETLARLRPQVLLLDHGLPVVEEATARLEHVLVES
jgi:glyoxylase-like metal-dependent hydrolase (beta-lactamase superfamily II)